MKNTQPHAKHLFCLEQVAAGLAIGSCSHAVGTSKAIEIGEVEGAMSGLAIGICGIITVLFSMLII